MPSVIIPVRMASSRFYGKPLAKINGIPMIKMIYDNVKSSKLIKDIYIATCDKEIRDYCSSVGIKCIMTSDKHRGCIDRVVEASEYIQDNGYILLQGDEPLITSDTVDEFAKALDYNSLINGISYIETLEEFNDKNVVKVVISNNNHILYMSRAPIPNHIERNVIGYKQLGIIGFNKYMLDQYKDIGETKLELYESVDMNRYIENGNCIKSIVINYKTHAVDIPDDIPIVEMMINEKNE